MAIGRLAIIVQLKGFLDELPALRQRGYDNAQDFELWCDKVQDCLRLGLGDTHARYRRFCDASPNEIRMVRYGDPSTYQRVYLNEVKSKERALKSVIQALEMEAAQVGKVSEVVYPAGSSYDAYKAIRELIKQSSQQLTVADSYVDSTLLDLLGNTKQNVHIRILTRSMQGDFKLVATKLKQQRGNLEVRQDPGELHDRFLVVDSEVYHLGASIKDAGNKVFGINRLERPQVIQATMQIIGDIWNRSTVVV